MAKKNPREELAAKCETHGGSAGAFAAFLRTGKVNDSTPCWGAITDKFDELVDTDDDRISLWPEMLAVGDKRVLLLFLYVNRQRLAVMTRVLEDAVALPRTIQRALVLMWTAAGWPVDELANLHPAATQLLDAGAEALDRERRLLYERIGRLMSMRSFAFDAISPEAGG